MKKFAVLLVALTLALAVTACADTEEARQEREQVERVYGPAGPGA